jgi:hypothetical protein
MTKHDSLLPSQDSDDPALISELLTVRDRPVLFTKSGSSLSEALTAVERGAFPISPSGFYSLAGCYNYDSDEPDEPETHPDDILNQKFLDKLATEHSRNLREAIARGKRAANLRCEGTVTHYISLDMAAARATHYGFFASDNDRRDLWQTAYRLYHLICDSGLFIPQNMRESNDVWTVEHCTQRLAQSREQFALLKQLMSGNFNVRPTGWEAFHNFISCGHYFDLPPKPEGDPVIPPPAITQSFDFSGDVIRDSDEADDLDVGDDEDAEEWDEDEPADEPHDAATFPESLTPANATAPAVFQQLELL